MSRTEQHGERETTPESSAKYAEVTAETDASAAAAKDETSITISMGIEGWEYFSGPDQKLPPCSYDEDRTCIGVSEAEIEKDCAAFCIAFLFIVILFIFTYMIFESIEKVFEWIG